ncbi:FAD-dependent oxidoreductase [Rhodobacter sp. SGA-6-6]|uniref:FAD-dependent oxidoreductase n=1 Tax=Rhodobacter sp. SGA-6-6 TaxID=2710882 RepID=UPI0013ED9F1D|nr:FAD-dependent oxidoreductase [Rhodobacter sp. SGA-6-6]NGM47789.1 FAD-dependent oxidoreductase [Rhodobacter sp. SGA-6-6]
MALPAQVSTVIIGGGIIGCSIAYHLTKLGIRDVLLLERRQLCCGTTWHSVGSVAELRGTRRMTELTRYTAELYRNLEAETGQATGYKKSGSIMLALNRERLMEMERAAALARQFGHDAEMISLADIRDRCPQVVIDDALAGFYISSDGRTNPVDTTQALAKGARMGGAKIVENVEVTGLQVVNGEVRGVLTTEGPVQAESVVLAAGMWGREFGAAHGVSLPLQAAEHFYAVTEPIPGLQPSMPFIRVPDESTYYKEDAGKLLFGCLEKRAKPWALDGIPKDFCFDSLPEDFDHFEPILTAALKRFPLLETAGIQLFFNGPESFTPDGNALMGETPELRNLFVACGLNTVGVMTGGAMGLMMAEWIANRRRPEGFAEYDVARFSPFQSRRSYMRDRTVEALGVLYDVGWPNREHVSARGGRRLPLHHQHKGAHAIFGSRAGWEVPLVFAPDAERAVLQPSYGRQNWVEWAAAEATAADEEAVLFDLSADAKLRVMGAEAVAALHRLGGQNAPPQPGLTTAVWLTATGKIETAVRILTVGNDEAYVLSVPGTERLHRKWLAGAGIAPDAIQTVTSAHGLFLLLGPKVDECLAGVGAGQGAAELRMAEIGYAPAVIAPTSVGGARGVLVLLDSEFAAHAAETLRAAGLVRQGGLYALESLRISVGEPAWPNELGDTVMPQEAGLAQGKMPRTTALVGIALATDTGALYGAEGILCDGRPVGLTSSGAWCHRRGVPVALGFVSNSDGVDAAWLSSGSFSIDMPGGPVKAHLRLIGG